MDQIVFQKARPQDASALAEASKRAFHSDVHCGAPPGPPGGPPGYDSPQWQRKMMRFGDYFTIVVGKRIVSGFIVFRKAPREYELGCIFVDPDFQNQGIGTQAFEFLWQEFPLAKRWMLGTPAWNQRTRHFYRKVGFEEIGEDAHEGIHFERRIVRAATSKS